MTDPLTLGALGAVAFTEGIKFLFDQARTVLQRRRETKDVHDTVQLEPSTAPILDGELAGTEVSGTLIDTYTGQLSRLRRDLIEYAEEGIVADPGDSNVLATAEALRRVLEDIYGQKITFLGEQRGPTGTVVKTTVKVRTVEGRAVGVHADTNSLQAVSEIVTNAEVDTVAPDGTLIGTRLEDRHQD